MSRLKYFPFIIQSIGTKFTDAIWFTESFVRVLFRLAQEVNLCFSRKNSKLAHELLLGRIYKLNLTYRLVHEDLLPRILLHLAREMNFCFSKKLAITDLAIIYFKFVAVFVIRGGQLIREMQLASFDQYLSTSTNISISRDERTSHALYYKLFYHLPVLQSQSIKKVSQECFQNIPN